MQYLKNLFGAGSMLSRAGFFLFKVRCERCGETLEGKVSLSNDLSADDEGGYHVRKVLMGSGRCFQQIEVALKFDASRRLVDMQVSGGKFVEETDDG